ncbi:MAG: transketolase [Omnitrophica bacterium RIFCSPLOWO2_12_FULL_44_17]|uniref:Transketolase n=1 Tax=Candidatus Danuiimicrobium aquiferis TaxID=1801832 RepID=A0A1G1KQ98_9BACT|nr:MAG: transketolase [Omnitrophica bacterium RIFCSPHIGHO2_02_FULL_45_28]OGW91088.1 MAG: transketolase [Omnitrophica bacterium RIFCSPHIGHO2_12_FULL_44_12]OGW95058.1 MAG: transketolase [Omnitrophica bacterium RIFCSPLOWO2_12_FULL_44_17]OGX02978.1 MAG: transketolase [Omnitrophica bacterium RIFCSPLOWO2_02_FULL_44_11]
MNEKLIQFLKNKVKWIREETLKIHKIAPDTRIASCLSDIEIFAVLYYGKLLKFNPKNPKWDNRDRFIVSKGHGGVSLYPVLADLGYFGKNELNNVCRNGSRFGSIPDSMVEGFETINGSLGQGLGVGCGMALGLKRKKSKSYVFVLVGDGELYEGSNWEAIMFAAHHQLDNLILIVDNNKIAMLDYCKNIINLKPLENKFKAFNWKAKVVNGHHVEKVYHALNEFKKDKGGRPKVLIADTKKGKGVPGLENNSLCHVMSLKPEEVDRLVAK